MQQKSQKCLKPFFTLLNLVPMNLYVLTSPLLLDRWPFSSSMMLCNSFFPLYNKHHATKNTGSLGPDNHGNNFA